MFSTMLLRSSKRLSMSKSSKKSASVAILTQKKSLCSMETKYVACIIFQHPYIVRTIYLLNCLQPCIFSPLYCNQLLSTRSSKVSVKLKIAPITSNSQCSSPPNKSQLRINKKLVPFLLIHLCVYICLYSLYHSSSAIVIICSPNMFFLRHQRLHKLIFDEDGLPDGAEVAYYARGQVVYVCVLRKSYCVCITLLTVLF